MSYDPQVNDYVMWTKGVEGWVYFKSQKYLTIEQSVRLKNTENYEACSLHRNERVLVLCYHDQWKELTHIRSRESIHEETKDDMEIVGKGTGAEGK